MKYKGNCRLVIDFIDRKAAKEMVEDYFGSLMWDRSEDNISLAWPDEKVAIRIEPQSEGENG